jgi:heme-degrading monooxygenase HmoA
LIRARAYRFYEERGCEHGHDFEDWLQAESEIAGKTFTTEIEGLKMFARNVHFRIKSLDMDAEFAQILERKILPLLRKQEGFKGEITLSNPGNLERISISLWESKSHAEAYDANFYSQVLKILSKVIDGTPKVRTFEAVALNLDHGSAAGRQNS